MSFVTPYLPWYLRNVFYSVLSSLFLVVRGLCEVLFEVLTDIGGEREINISITHI